MRHNMAYPDIYLTNQELCHTPDGDSHFDFQGGAISIQQQSLTMWVSNISLMPEVECVS